MNTSFIDIFFRLFNFAIFVGLIIYYFRKHILGYIQTQILRKKTYTDDLIQKKAGLEHTRSALLEHMKTQDTLYNELDRKVAQWHAAVQKNQHLEINRRTRYHNQLLNRLSSQIDSYRSYKEKERIVPKVFDAARQSLVSLFADEKQGHAYNQRALVTLKRTSG